MKRLGWAQVAGVGVAGLLVAGIPAYAGGDKTASGQTSDEKAKGSSSTQSDTSTSPGTTGSSSATGSSTAPSEQPGMGASASANELSGKVEKFDRESNELTIANSDKKLKVDDETRVMKDGQQASLTDIQEGDQVRASFSGSGDTLQVTRLEVMSSGSAGPSGSSTTGSGSSPSTGTPPSGTGTPPSGSDAPPSGSGSGTSPSGSDTPPSGSSGSTTPGKGY